MFITERRERQVQPLVLDVWGATRSAEDSSPSSCVKCIAHMKTRNGLLNVRFPSLVMLCGHAASSQSRLKKAVSHLDELRINLAL